MKAYARVGFRTENLSPINVMEGFTLRKKLALSGPDGPIKLEVHANVALPEPEIEYSTENQRSLVGMGDIEVNIEEMNLVPCDNLKLFVVKLTQMTKDDFAKNFYIGGT